MTQSITVEYEDLPERSIPLKDWATVCDRLEAGEEPTYKMSEKNTRALYVWALKNRSYRISTLSILPGIYKVSKGETI